MLRELLNKIVEEQNIRNQTMSTGEFHFPVDIVLSNGNILLRAFRIISLEGTRVKGITWMEEYSAPREGREPVYSIFGVDEIASLHCFDLEMEYLKQEVSKS